MNIEDLTHTYATAYYYEGDEKVIVLVYGKIINKVRVKKKEDDVEKQVMVGNEN